MSKVDWTQIPDLTIPNIARDYIDFLDEKDVPLPVMKGQDCQGRNFVTVKLLVDGKPIFEVFFQRYHRNTYPGPWLWESQRKIIDHSIKKTQWDFVERIINGEEVVCPDNSCYDPIGIRDELVGMKIKLNN